MALPIVVEPKYGIYADPPTDDELRQRCPVNRNFLRSDGVVLMYDSVARLNGLNIRQAILSETWAHPAHGRAIRYYVNAVAAPEDGNDLFFGVTEAPLPWCWGWTYGVDCFGRMRWGAAPYATVRDQSHQLPPRRAPKQATFTVTIDFSIGKATLCAYRDIASAKEERDLIFEHDINISRWTSARLWFTTASQDTVVCLANIDVLSYVEMKDARSLRAAATAKQGPEQPERRAAKPKRRRRGSDSDDDDVDDDDDETWYTNPVA